MQKKTIQRGDIYYANLDPIVGSEQGGTCRPTIVVSNNVGNSSSPTVVIVPITGNIRKPPLPTHVAIPKSCGLEKDSIALAEQIRTVDRSRLDGYIGRITYETQSAVDRALAICVGLESRRQGELLVLTLCPRCQANFTDSGYSLVKKGWQNEKTDCDFCQTNKGLIFGIFK